MDEEVVESVEAEVLPETLTFADFPERIWPEDYEAILKPVMRALRPIAEWAGRNCSHVYDNEDEDQASGLGYLIATYFSWDGPLILLLAAEALGTANFRKESDVLNNMLVEMLGKYAEGNKDDEG